MNRPYNVVVCGTRFGEHYLAALLAMRSLQTPRYRLAGVVARGSERSRALATHLDVPLYASVDNLPSDIDIGCVVVRSRIVGGDGSDLAGELLRRGISVIQEHPVHPTDIQRLSRLAAQSGARYHVNTLYPNLPAGRCFIDYAMQSASQRRPVFIEMTTSLQLLYSSLDIAGRALGGLTPFACTPPLALDSLPMTKKPWPFRSLQGCIGGVPFALHLQNYLDPADPDHHSLVMHRIAIGGPEGNVCLTGSFGPVVWSHAIYASDYERNDDTASYLLNPELHASSRYNRQPAAVTFGSAQAPDLIEATRHDFPVAIQTALDELTATTPPLWQSPSYWQEHGEVWLGLMRAIGTPVAVSQTPPPEPYPNPVAFAQQYLSPITL